MERYLEATYTRAMLSNYLKQVLDNIARVLPGTTEKGDYLIASPYEGLNIVG